MRYYRFQSTCGKIRPTIASELEILSMFPEDAASLRQAGFIIRDEYQRLKTSGDADYLPSELSRIILRHYNRKVTRRTTVALVALAMVALDDIGEKMSLKRASAAISEYSLSEHGTTLFQRSESDIETSQKPLTSDRKSIENIFRENRSVAHILAAQACVAEEVKPKAGFTGDLQTDRLVLATAIHLQQRISKAENFDDWEVWWIEIDPPDEARKLPAPCIPKAETLAKLLGPWMSAGRPVD